MGSRLRPLDYLYSTFNLHPPKLRQGARLRDCGERSGRYHSNLSLSLFMKYPLPITICSEIGSGVVCNIDENKTTAKVETISISSIPKLSVRTFSKTTDKDKKARKETRTV